MQSISVNQEVFKALKAHALAEAPNEACGLVSGTKGVGSGFYAIGNANPSPVTYDLDSAGQIAAMRDMREAGAELMAIFHSHPGSPAVPSSTDVLRAFYPGTRDENFPGVAYIIASVSGGEVIELRAFLITPEGINEITIKAT